MNILYLSELNPFVCNGGGEIILRGLLNRGIEEFGHDIVVRTASDDQFNTIGIIKDADLIICADCFNEPNKQPRTWFSDTVISSLWGTNYITCATGHSDWCNKDYTIPCFGEKDKIGICEDCPRNNSLIGKFLASAKLNVFLSPLQKQTAEDIMQMKFVSREGNDKSYILCPEIEKDMFYDMGLERDIDYIICGVICEAKGYYEICDMIEKNGWQDKNVQWIGDSLVGKVKYGTHVPKIPREEMPKFMNRAKHIFGLSVWPEAWGLVYGESLLCNCELIHNDRIGMLSCFKNDSRIAKAELSKYKKYYTEFWKKI